MILGSKHVGAILNALI